MIPHPKRLALAAWLLASCTAPEPPPRDGATSDPADRSAQLVSRAESLDSVASALGDVPTAWLEAGAAWLDVGSLLGGNGPWYDRAGERLQRAFDLAPDLPAAREKLASWHTKLGHAEQALALLDEGIRRDATYAGFHDQRGYVLRYAGWMAASIESYRRAQSLDPAPTRVVSAQDQITKSLIYRGDWPEALRSHARVEELLDSLGRPATEKEHFYKGVILLYAGDTAAAVASFRRGREVDPGTVWSTFGEGYEAIATGDRAAVRDVLARLEGRDVVDGERRYRLVHLAAFLDDHDLALAHLAAAIEAGFFAAPYFETDALTEGLRESPGFASLLEKARMRHGSFAGSIVATP